MKSFLLLALFVSPVAFAAPITLDCSANEAGFQAVTISEVGTHKITVDLGGGDTYELNKTQAGDCKGRAFFDCYLDGQLMVNIPKSLSTGKKSEAKVWLNLDVDDDTSNGRLGESYNCSAR